MILSVVQYELDKFGLQIETVNIKQVEDLPGKSFLAQLIKEEDKAIRVDYKPKAATRLDNIKEGKKIKSAKLDTVSTIIVDEIKITHQQALLKAANDYTKLDLAKIKESNEYNAKMDRQQAKHDFNISKRLNFADAMLNEQQQKAKANEIISPAKANHIKLRAKAAGSKTTFEQVSEIQKLTDGMWKTMNLNETEDSYKDLLIGSSTDLNFQFKVPPNNNYCDPGMLSK
ncbi:hypothetical protein HK096_007994 [Nowakowskiella sp. JEL0078]|nr:hypothetical protein HK096_007994 [Nowakowskiella sp. JEL0078]